MKSVRNILDAKGRQVWTIRPTDSVFDALKLMAEKNVGALVVTEADRVRGIFSERDYARKIILLDRSSKNTPVSAVMDSTVLYAWPSQTVDECMALVTEKRVRHLPVVEDGVLEGLVSIGDLVKAVIEDQQFIIEQLEHYIAG